MCQVRKQYWKLDHSTNAQPDTANIPISFTTDSINPHPLPCQICILLSILLISYPFPQHDALGPGCEDQKYESEGGVGAAEGDDG